MPPTITNCLIQSLSVAAREQLVALLERVDLPVRTSLQLQEEAHRYAYFLNSGVASVVVTMSEGGTAETNLIGREGLAGGVSLLGSSIPPTECFMQVGGEGYRIPFPKLQRLFLCSDDLRTQILACVQQQSLTTSLLAGCNKLHDAEARLARWILMLQDRTGGDSFQLTQEFLAQMLGTRRTTVALVAGTLQRGGLIEYSRGKMTVLSRQELMATACECYPITLRLLQDLDLDQRRATQ